VVWHATGETIQWQVVCIVHGDQMSWSCAYAGVI